MTEKICEILGWSELAQGGQEAGFIRSGNKRAVFTIHGRYF